MMLACLLYIGSPVFAKQPLVSVSLVTRGSPLLIFGLLLDSFPDTEADCRYIEDEATGRNDVRLVRKSV